jgi:hypothetical protein
MYITVGKTRGIYTKVEALNHAMSEDKKSYFQYLYESNSVHVDTPSRNQANMCPIS